MLLFSCIFSLSAELTAFSAVSRCSFANHSLELSCDSILGFANFHSAAQAMAGPASGKPILTFGDMLRDLSDRRPTRVTEPDEPDSPTTIKQKKIAHLRSLFYSSNPLLQTKAATERGSSLTQVEGPNLVNAFEKVYSDLTEALSGDGNEWVGLSEQLSTLLRTANHLISTANKETGPLVDQIRLLQALVERGRSALANAQTSMLQT